MSIPDLDAVEARHKAYIDAMIGDDLTPDEACRKVWESADDVPHLVAEIRRLYQVIDRVLILARKHRDDETRAHPGEVFAAVYLSDRAATPADIQRGKEIWAEITEESR